MKLTLPFLLCVLFFGCTSPAQIENEYVTDYDSILVNSQNNLDTAAVINHKSDSVTKESIVKVIREIKVLNKEVEKYKEVSKLNTLALEKIVYKIDTVYIETKKNFWGKEKTNTTIKSDSTIIIDSLKN